MASKTSQEIDQIILSVLEKLNSLILDLKHHKFEDYHVPYLNATMVTAFKLVLLLQGKPVPDGEWVLKIKNDEPLNDANREEFIKDFTALRDWFQNNI
jgi:hypothetical protein